MAGGLDGAELRKSQNLHRPPPVKYHRPGGLLPAAPTAAARRTRPAGGHRHGGGGAARPGAPARGLGKPPAPGGRARAPGLPRSRPDLPGTGRRASGRRRPTAEARNRSGPIAGTRAGPRTRHARLRPPGTGLRGVPVPVDEVSLRGDAKWHGGRQPDGGAVVATRPTARKGPGPGHGRPRPGALLQRRPRSRAGGARPVPATHCSAGDHGQAGPAGE